MKPVRTILPWLGLAAILLGYAAFIARLHPANLFGLQEDDSIYFSSGKAIAEGQGYVMPSVPGEPSAANRYPVIYPWMLSRIWRWNPSFPANVNDAVALNAVFGFAYITFAFIFFRRSMKMGDSEALLLTVFCAFHPIVLFCSVTVIADMLFAALCLGALVLADRAAQSDGSRTVVALCGVLAGLSILTRTTGYPIVVGILAIAIVRKAWRQAGLFGSIVAVFFAFFEWEKLSAARAMLPAGWSTLTPGFRQTWLAYTDYVGFRSLSIVSPRVVIATFTAQFSYFFATIPGYFLSTFFGRHVFALFFLTVALLWLVFAGLMRTVKRDGWKPVHVALGFYVAMVLAWNYPSWDRYLLPFLPLFTAALWTEGKWAAGELWREVRSDHPRGNRTAAFCAGLALAAVALTLAWNFAANPDRASLFDISRNRAKLLTEKREAYDWLQQNSPVGSNIIAVEDVCLYLYTGRRSMAPINLLPYVIYEPKQMQSDLDHLTDVATDIKASYWLMSPDDNDQEWTAAKPLLDARESEIAGVLPELFRSRSGNVRIYGLGCLQNPQDSSCRLADLVLFPEGHSAASAQRTAAADGAE